VRRRWRALLVVAPGDPYAPPLRLKVPPRRSDRVLPVLHARLGSRQLSLRLRTPRRRLAWDDLREILRGGGASVPLT
jgi:hypothetical protein